MIRTETTNNQAGTLTVETWDTVSGYTRTVNAVTVETRPLTAAEVATVNADTTNRTRQTNRATLVDPAQIAAWTTAADTFLANVSPTNAQTLAQVQRNTRAIRRLAKLLLAADIPTLLDDTTGT